MINFSITLLNNNKSENSRSNKLSICLLPLLIIPLCLAIKLITDALYIEWSDEMSKLAKSVIISSGIVTLTSIMGTISGPTCVDRLLLFHKTYNAANIDRYPIKFFFKRKNWLLNFFRFGFFFSSIIMLYGAFWG